MDLSFKCPLCETYFESQDDLKEHVKDSHTSYYYDTYLVPPLLLTLPEPTPLLAPATVITSEPVVSSPDVIVTPVEVEDDCCGGCCDCCGGDGAGASGIDGGAGDCDCDCDCGDCVVM